MLSSFCSFFKQVLWLQSSAAFKAFALPLSCSEVCAFSVPNQMLSSFLVFAPHSSFYTERVGLRQCFVKVYLWLVVLFVLLKKTVQMFWLEAQDKALRGAQNASLALLWLPWCSCICCVLLCSVLCVLHCRAPCQGWVSSLSPFSPDTESHSRRPFVACVVVLWRGCSSTFYSASI